MKRCVKITVIVLAAIVFLSALYLVVPGFAKHGNAYIADYVVSEDGSEISIKVGVSTSIGYVRKVSVHQQHGGKLYLDCYSAFGGINGSWGAKTEFTIPLDEETKTIAIYRSTNCYDTVLEKMDDGKWMPKNKLIYGEQGTSDDTIQGEGDTLDTTVYKLVNGSLEFEVEPNVDVVQMIAETFQTNTTQIVVTTNSKLDDDEISVLLYSVKDGDDVFIGSSSLASDETSRKIIFANLTSANTYKIGVSTRNLSQKATIVISDGN